MGIAEAQAMSQVVVVSLNQDEEHFLEMTKLLETPSKLRSITL